MLQKLGYNADLASNGLEAIRFVQTVPYDIVLMDVQMPHMDGFSATRWIRANVVEKKPLKIVAMTANSDSGEREKCLRAGMNDYISKPVRIDALHEILVRCAVQLQLRSAI